MRRDLASAERFSDAAMRPGSFQVKTPDSRSSTSLCFVAWADQRLAVVRLRAVVRVPGFFLAGLRAIFAMPRQRMPKQPFPFSTCVYAERWRALQIG